MTLECLPQVTHRPALGMSEVALIDLVMRGCCHLARMEDDISREEPVVLPGQGPDSLPGCSAEECPEEMPEMSGHRSLMARVLCKDPPVCPGGGGCTASPEEALQRKPMRRGGGDPKVRFFPRTVALKVRLQIVMPFSVADVRAEGAGRVVGLRPLVIQLCNPDARALPSLRPS